MQYPLVSALSLVLVVGAGSPARIHPAAQQRGFTIPSESAWTIHDLVSKYADLTGASVSFTEQSLDVARKTQLVLDSPLEVDAKNIDAIVESLLLRYDFVLTQLRAGEPRILAVDALIVNRSSLLRKAILVPAQDLDAFADRAATVVQTIVHLQEIDAQKASASLRSIMNDCNFERATPVGDGRSVILTGNGAQVVRLARLLVEADRELAKQRGREVQGK